ncbi:MAG: GNAT family protein [Planctomycetota bacterium]
MQIDLAACRLRNWRATDAESLVRHANDRGIAASLRDRFPHPYTRDDATQFLARTAEHEPPGIIAIEVADEAAGCIGFERCGDVERVGAELGYWLGREHWGRGIMTRAVGAATSWALEAHGLERIFAKALVTNLASHRVLEKVGFQREGLLRRSAIKAGVVHDQVLYAFVPGAGDVAR